MNKVAEIRARCTLAEHKALALLARRDSQAMSEIVRRAIRKLARQEDVWLDAQREAIKHLEAEAEQARDEERGE